MELVIVDMDKPFPFLEEGKIFRYIETDLDYQRMVLRYATIRSDRDVVSIKIKTNLGETNADDIRDLISFKQELCLSFLEEMAQND